MKIEPGRIMNDFIEPNKRQYIIPVYQRNYEWDREQCVKLFEDIVLAFRRDKSHFVGSVVYAPLEQVHGILYYVIVDGQQRLTTIYLLLKALIDCAKTDKERESITDTVFNRDKFDEYGVQDASKLKLKPVKSDNQQLYLLMEDKYEEIDKSSGIWANYVIFKEQVEALLKRDPDISVRDIYRGIEKLICATILLDADDNAQEIFERINSTGVPLSLSDQIRNYVLMTDANQEKLYEDYWLKVEKLVEKENMSAFFLDYLNCRLDGFTREDKAYEDFKQLYLQNKYTNEKMLWEIRHYAEFYHVFLHGDASYGEAINTALEGLRLLNQSTVYLFLFRVFDDCEQEVISKAELERVLVLLLNYSIRRIMCEISSNSLRGLYKTLYNRVFNTPENKAHYYDAIVSFLMQMTSRDAIPSDEDFRNALINNNLYRKHALCRYLLIGIENQGKEKVVTDALSIEHIMPQNRNLSTAWQRMLGDNWMADKDHWLHTLGNLTLTGYNSELGDRPFPDKKKMIEKCSTKIVILYKDVQDRDNWNAATIQARANRLADEVLKLHPIAPPEHAVSFTDSRYKEYTCAEPGNATYKTVNYYDLLGERVAVGSFADMVRSVAKKLYEMDSSIIERMARSGETFTDWINPVFSYDKDGVKGDTKLEGTNIYISTGYSAYDCVSFIRGLLRKYDLDIEEDFIYSARSTKTDGEKDDAEEPVRYETRQAYWTYALPIIQRENVMTGAFSNCAHGKSNATYGSFGLGGFYIACIANYDQARILLTLMSSDADRNKAAFDALYGHRDEIEHALGTTLVWDRGEDSKSSWLTYSLEGVSIANAADWPKMAQFHAEWSAKICDTIVPFLRSWSYEQDGKADSLEKDERLLTIAALTRKWALSKDQIDIDLAKCNRTYTRFRTPYMAALFPDVEGAPSGWNTAGHCFYEVLNRDGKSLYVWLAISAKNIPDDQRAVADFLAENYRKNNDNPDWQWRSPFRTKKYDLAEVVSEEDVFQILDSCMAEIENFEKDVAAKWQQPDGGLSQ